MIMRNFGFTPIELDGVSNRQVFKIRDSEELLGISSLKISSTIWLKGLGQPYRRYLDVSIVSNFVR